MQTLSVPNPFKVGDILHHQFHYTASFPEFYKVVRVTPKTVEIVRIGNRMSYNGDGYGQSGEYMPDLSNVSTRTKKAKVGMDYYGEPGVLVDSYFGHVAHLWDGKPKEFWGD